jgi:hypothetical protein
LTAEAAKNDRVDAAKNGRRGASASEQRHLTTDLVSDYKPCLGTLQARVRVLQ